MMWRLVAVTACLLAVGADAMHTKGPWNNVRKRIVGGEEVDISEFPWQVVVLFDGGYVCGGSIISQEWVLTAAHCILYPGSVERYSVRAGSSKWNDGGNEYKADDLIIHSSYKAPSLDYDICLIKISGRILMDDNVKAVNLATSEPEVGTPMKISGWGATESDSHSPVLRAVTVEIQELSSCNSIQPTTGRMLCASAKQSGKGPCGGDSGGPLVVGNTQYGLLSGGDLCGCHEIRDIYTNVAALRSWIHDKAGV